MNEEKGPWWVAGVQIHAAMDPRGHRAETAAELRPAAYVLAQGGEHALPRRARRWPSPKGPIR
jgi:hypothetical protein